MGVNKIGLDGEQSFAVHAKFAQSGGMKIGHHDIGLFHQAMKDGLSFGLMQVDGDGFLIAIGDLEQRRMRV